jgi:hypothetical protein
MDQGKCPKCGDSLVDRKPFCPNCGSPVLVIGDQIAINKYVLSIVSDELSNRLKDQSSLVRELGDKVEEVVRRRIGVYTFILAVAAFLTGLWGYNSLNAAKDKITQDAQARIEPTIKKVEARIGEVGNTVSISAEKIKEIGVKATAQQKILDNVSSVAEAQRRRVLEQSGEIEKKVADFDAASNRAERLSTDFQTRIAGFGAQIDKTIRRYDAQVAGVVRSNNEKQILNAYPNIDQDPFVTISGFRITKDQKRPSEKWIDLTLSDAAIAQHLLSGQRLLELTSQLQKAGFTSYIGVATLQGRWNGGLAPGALIRGSAKTRIGWTVGVYYFDPAFVASARQILSITSKFIDTSKGAVQYVDLTEPGQAAYREQLQFLIERSGLDCQLYITGQ